MSFSFRPLEIPEVILVETPRFEDDRGFFMELFRETPFQTGGVKLGFVQDNFAVSTKGVLRGLHYQNPPQAQGKLVRALRGEVFDVAVDIRRGSPTFGRWVGEILSGDNGRALWVPPGFAHGYCVLSSGADVFYKVTRPFSPDLDRGIRWDDPAVGVEWPVHDPVLSDKDLGLPLLADADNPNRWDGAPQSGGSSGEGGGRSS